VARFACTDDVHADVETEESLVRLIESPTAESEPAASAGSTESLQVQLLSCQLTEKSRHVEPAICGYYHTLSRTAFQQPQAEQVDTSNDGTSAVSDSDSQSSVSMTDGAESEIEPTSDMDNTSSEAAKAVATMTAELMSDDAESTAAASSVSSSPPGNDAISLILCYSSSC